jgi:hypothetical protein
VSGDAARPSGGVDDKVGGEVVPVDDDATDPAPLCGNSVSMTNQEGDSGLRLGGTAQDALEGAAAAAQAEDKLPEIGNRKCLGASREQRLEDVRHVRQQRVADLLPERMRVMELHDAPTVPGLRGAWPSVAVNQHDGVVAPGEGDGAVQPGRPCPDDSCPHSRPYLRYSRCSGYTDSHLK